MSAQICFKMPLRCGCPVSRNLTEDRHILKLTMLESGVLQGHEMQFVSALEAFLQPTAVTHFCPTLCPDQRKQPNYYL